MQMAQKLSNLEDLLNRIEAAAQDRDPVSVEAILQMVGRRSFGPLVLAAGLVILAPLIGDIPGVPTIIGGIVFLLAIQLLAGRDYFWLPGLLLRRSIASGKLCKALKWVRPSARFVDRLLRPRLTMLTNGIAIYVIAILCTAIAAAMPMMEVVPFSANAAGVALVAFGVSLISDDGLVAIIAFMFTGGTIGLVIYNLL